MSFNKIKLITKREYITRVRKKSFIIMTILAPILMSLTMIIPIWVANLKDESEKKIAIIDKTNQFYELFKDNQILKFEHINSSNADEFKNTVKENDYYGVLTIYDTTGKIQPSFHSYKQPGLEFINQLSNIIEKEIEKKKLKALSIDLDKINSAKVQLGIEVFKWKETGEQEKSFTEIAMAVGFISAIVIYMFVFIYGSQVMRSVMEEKTSRIVEIIISSVKPFELMMGKILGVAGVALTQFTIWILSGLLLFSLAQPLFMPKNINNQEITKSIQGYDQNIQIPQDNSKISEIFTAIQNIDYISILALFLFYFLGGYLLYSSLFAAIGSAVDNETDTQQFMLPISIPLILSFIVAQAIIQNPEGQIAFWFSIIPLTSPIIMMVRIAFGIPEAVPYWQLALSMFLLIISFLGSTWLAGKIYRTGILMYGKKVNYRELWKWIRYKN